MITSSAQVGVPGFRPALHRGRMGNDSGIRIDATGGVLTVHTAAPSAASDDGSLGLVEVYVEGWGDCAELDISSNRLLRRPRRRPGCRAIGCWNRPRSEQPPASGGGARGARRHYESRARALPRDAREGAGLQRLQCVMHTPGRGANRQDRTWSVASSAAPSAMRVGGLDLGCGWAPRRAMPPIATRSGGRITISPNKR